MNRAFKYRLYPTIEQRELFIKTFGCCRKVYNLMLAEKIENYKQTGKFATVTPAKYKKKYTYLDVVNEIPDSEKIVVKFIAQNKKVYGWYAEKGE